MTIATSPNCAVAWTYSPEYLVEKPVIHAFQSSIVVNEAGDLAEKQSTPRKAFDSFVLAKVEGRKIISFTGAIRVFNIEGNPGEGILEKLEQRHLPPSDFLAQHDLAEIISGVNQTLLQFYPSSSAAYCGLGALAILARREQGMVELATLEKPHEYFSSLAKAIEFDPTLVDCARLHAKQIANTLYRSKALNGLNDQIGETALPVYTEPFKSIYLEGLSQYLLTHSGEDPSLSWAVSVAPRNHHAAKVSTMLIDYFKHGQGAAVEASHLTPQFMRYMISVGVKLQTSPQYTASALKDDDMAALYIEAGYSWKLSPSLAVFTLDDVHDRGAAWIEKLLSKFQSRDMNEQGFWELDNANACISGRDILKAIRKSDLQGFQKILERLPQWAKMACLALGAVSIHEVENVPMAGQDRSFSRDLGL